MKTVSFIAKTGGNGDSFLWRPKTAEDHIAVVGEEVHNRDIEFEKDFRKDEAEMRGISYDSEETINLPLYPCDVCTALGVEEGRFYRFTVSVEEI